MRFRPVTRSPFEALLPANPCGATIKSSGLRRNQSRPVNTCTSIIWKFIPLNAIMPSASMPSRGTNHLLHQGRIDALDAANLDALPGVLGRVVQVVARTLISSNMSSVHCTIRLLVRSSASMVRAAGRGLPLASTGRPAFGLPKATANWRPPAGLARQRRGVHHLAIDLPDDLGYLRRVGVLQLLEVVLHHHLRFLVAHVDVVAEQLPDREDVDRAGLDEDGVDGRVGDDAERTARRAGRGAPPAPPANPPKPPKPPNCPPRPLPCCCRRPLYISSSMLATSTALASFSRMTSNSSPLACPWS